MDVGDWKYVLLEVDNIIVLAALALLVLVVQCRSTCGMPRVPLGSRPWLPAQWWQSSWWPRPRRSGR